MALAIGERVTAGSVNDEILAPTSALPLGIIPGGYGQRASNRAVTTTEAGVLRLDNLQLYAGRQYRISAPRVRFDSTTSTNRCQARIRTQLGGAVATTGSTFAARCELDNVCSGSLVVTLTSASTQLLSVLLSGVVVVFTAGTTNMMCTDEGGCELIVEDMGLAVSDVGVDL